MTVVGGQACRGPEGTVTVHIQPETFSLRIDADLDPHPDDWQIAMQMADACVGPGKPMRCVEEYEPGVNVFIVHMDPDSAFGQVAAAMALF
jgi:hypothetical protein